MILDDRTTVVTAKRDLPLHAVLGLERSLPYLTAKLCPTLHLISDFVDATGNLTNPNARRHA